MVRLVGSQDLGFGDSVLNFGDALYKDRPDRQAQSNVMRLCAYLLFASRVEPGSCADVFPGSPLPEQGIEPFGRDPLTNYAPGARNGDESRWRPPNR